MISTTSSVLERVYLMPKPGTDRLISATSAIFVGVGGLGSQIRLSRGIRTTDDAFWFYGRVVGSVQSQPSSASLVVSPASAFTVLGDGDSYTERLTRHVPADVGRRRRRVRGDRVAERADVVPAASHVRLRPRSSGSRRRHGHVFDGRHFQRREFAHRAEYGPEPEHVLRRSVCNRVGEHCRTRELHHSNRLPRSVWSPADD